MCDENIILMPPWVIDCLKDGVEVTSISGDDIIFDKNVGLDKDDRFGCTAFGFKRSKLRDSVIDNISG